LARLQQDAELPEGAMGDEPHQHLFAQHFTGSDFWRQGISMAIQKGLWTICQVKHGETILSC